MLIYLADNRSTVINLQCVGDMHIEKSRHGWEIKCEMSSVSGFGTTTCSLGCFACKENAVSKILEILKCYGEGQKVYYLYIWISISHIIEIERRHYVRK